jgi:ribosomal protein S18 acetylase RimI-like enzyme
MDDRPMREDAFEPRQGPRRMMKLALARQDPQGPWNFRAVEPEDIEPLAELMLDAYRGSVDFSDETVADARAEINKTFNHGYGRFIPEASLLVEDDGRPVSACLVTLLDDEQIPLLAFSMTAARHKNQGLAGFLIRHAINRLLDAGFAELALVVTVANQPALHLYEKLGFRPFA